MTATELDVLALIADGKSLGEYMPRYRPGARRGRGAFPVTIASRAAARLAKKRLVRWSDEVSRLVLTDEGEIELRRRRS